MSKAAPRAIFDAFSGFILALLGGILPFLYYIIIFATISGIAAAFISISYVKSAGPLDKQVNVIIPPRTSTIGIAQLLADKHVIEFPDLLAAIIKISKSGKSLKAGEYAFNPLVTPLDVIKKIQSGDVVIRRITLPEGLMTFQILDIIKNAPVLKGEVPDGLTEGELLPQTYDYHYGDSRKDVVVRMQESMRKTVDELWEKRKPNLLLQTKQEAIVLASIVEKETGVASERPHIAGVFLNRLKIGMRLQTDPTVIYAVTNGKSVLGRPLSHKDLEIDSPYNTYRNAGLPPLPIANPGKAALEAVLNPMDTDDLYFVASGNGGHVFSSNLKEHNENVNKLRKLEKDTQKGEAD